LSGEAIFLGLHLVWPKAPIVEMLQKLAGSADFNG